MKLQNYFYAAALLGFTAFASCKKSDDNNTTPGSGNLAAGKGAISFNSDIKFGAGTSYNGNNSLYTSATRQQSGTADQITIHTSQVSNTINIDNAQIIFYVPHSAATATSGNITIDFADVDKSNATTWGTLSLTSSAGTTVNPGYITEGGTGKFIITKLTATEIEGTFSGKLVNDDHGTINLSNGAFAGKF